MASQGTEKLHLTVALKGRGFSRAETALIFCDSERASPPRNPSRFQRCLPLLAVDVNIGSFRETPGGFMSDRDGSGFLWFLTGLGIGAAIGVLYAPRSGRETRETLVVKAEEGRDRVLERAQRARDQANEWVDKGREVLQQQKEQFKSAYEAGRQAYREATTEGESKV
jgi:gas vesicle protein